MTFALQTVVVRSQWKARYRSPELELKLSNVHEEAWSKRSTVISDGSVEKVNEKIHENTHTQMVHNKIVFDGFSQRTVQQCLSLVAVSFFYENKYKLEKRYNVCLNNGGNYVVKQVPTSSFL
ncbi:hypothetical protein TNCV_3321211 [Trichonephila clavipes]|nr:hypothetical protein TNCV_3321211 [Trichonephila clavipes]